MFGLMLGFTPACGGGSGTSAGTIGTGTTGTTTTTDGGDGVDSTADTTAGVSPSCVDTQQGNQDQNNAHPLPIDVTVLDAVSRNGVLCSGSDWFELEMPCNGYLGVEVRVLDDSGELVLRFRDDQTVLRETSGSFRIHAAHRPVVPQTYYVEVEHVSGAPLEYELQAYLLPDGTCTSASYLCHADALEIDATETSCLVFPSGGSCPSGQTHAQSVALPQVSDGQSGWVEGWAIQVAGDEVRNVHRPTAGSGVRGRCMRLARCVHPGGACADLSLILRERQFTSG